MDRNNRDDGGRLTKFAPMLPRPRVITAFAAASLLGFCAACASPMKPSNSKPLPVAPNRRGDRIAPLAASPPASPLETSRVRLIAQSTLRADVHDLQSLLESSHPD